MLHWMIQPVLWLTSRPAGQVLAALAFVLAPAWVHTLEPSDYSPALGYSSEAQSARNTSAVARLFGEFRTSMSDIMFIKTERYMHSGVAYAEPLEKEEEGKVVQTLIRPPEGDWRGFIGDLERQVKPWLDPKNHAEHTRGTELLPWFRLMTLVNPHRIRGYTIGALYLRISGQPNSLGEAKEFVLEGIRNNPKSHELHFTIVRILQQELAELDRAGADPGRRDQILSEALEYARSGVQFGAEIRPAQGWQGKGRPAEMEDSFIGCTHYEVLTLRRLGRNVEALDRARYFLQTFGHDPVLEGEIRELNQELGGSKG
jgi:hypothetical protein